MRPSALRCSKHLIGPPHPISNIRPVLYNFSSNSKVEALPSTSTPSTNSASSSSPTSEVLALEGSPYAVDEFAGSSAKEQSSITPASKDEWASRWSSVDNDRTNHLFWLDSNARFNAAKEALVKSYEALPQSPEQSEEDREVALDQALARFYRGWQVQEEKRQREYTMEMYRRTRDGVVGSFLSQRWVAKFLGR
ncbi:hypothetical protein DL93DRAFT_2093662 [Clavulina sp. PMI_390]|nr:hypothetical protein DL93DRAFT_2093662 [Clavulina sp. PMI_390]